MQNFYHIDQLIQGYFNQDHDLINEGEDTIEGTIELYKKTAPDWMLKELAEEVDCFLALYGDRLDEQFKSRYGFDFSPELWDSTPFDFLMTVRRLALSSK
ncbi:contact-dependent growth inhibition system immunity protein [Enterobacter hormaechei]|uniref:contact-dependent growth inhibition system immunity protein n=2 Tax=Enterobacter hormaechei TaxID=158836 RepID=UPI0029D9229D|nr:contact-dependent growth inhibition system immunity protein [Enterobacter hormaechei]MDX7123430.1 contact-dependent growth inhibition system immunity protein [Enterobacter hormaechei]HDF8568942.1 hypothetical protein [Enterobacter hormaechei subsp. hoffmannii]